MRKKMLTQCSNNTIQLVVKRLRSEFHLCRFAVRPGENNRPGFNSLMQNTSLDYMSPLSAP